MRWQSIPPVRWVKEEIYRYRRIWRFQKTVKEDLKWHHDERDQKDTKQTTPPKSENIELHCVWVTEAYTPSNIGVLIRSIKKLGWDKPGRSIGRGDSLIERIQETRSVNGWGAWMNAGVILRHGDTRFPTANKRFAKLPVSVDYCRLSLRNVTSSLTLLTIQFVLVDDYAGSVNGILSSTYKSKVEYYPSRLRSKNASFIGVPEQKKREIRKNRDQIHEGLYKWFSRNLPGHYAGLSGSVYPTIDFITSRKYIRKKEDDRLERDSYMDIVFGSPVETWTCKDDKNLDLRLPWFRTEQPLAVLSGNYEKLTENIERYGGKDRAALTSKLHMDFEATIGVWAAHNLLLSYEKGLANVRDRTASRLGVRTAINDIKYIRKQYLSLSRDVQAVSRDVAKLAASDRSYAADTLDFSPPVYLKEFSKDLIETFRAQDETRAKELDAFEDQVGKAVLTNGELATAVANIRIQRYVFWLTIIITIFTIVAIFQNRTRSTDEANRSSQSKQQTIHSGR